jgi:hypothetical protein
MANVCFNYIEAFGDAKAIEKFNNEMLIDDQMYSLETIDCEEGKIRISSETRWSPPEEWVINNSKEFGLLIECEYGECGANISGKFGFDKGEKVFDLEFTYLEGRYNLLDWYEFVEFEVLHRIEDNEDLETFLEDFDFVSLQEREELITIFNEGI